MFRFIYKIFTISVFCIALALADSPERRMAELGDLRSQCFVLMIRIGQIVARIDQLVREAQADLLDLTGTSDDNRDKVANLKKEMNRLKSQFDNVTKQIAELENSERKPKNPERPKKEENSKEPEAEPDKISKEELNKEEPDEKPEKKPAEEEDKKDKDGKLNKLDKLTAQMKDMEEQLSELRAQMKASEEKENDKKSDGEPSESGSKSDDDLQKERPVAE
ncbi:MAG: hypothetical protein LBI20_00545 [Holosporales bacterium]|jgi:chromosome segregation ATPase|nr:hypothetical protein [Holosporales bacterium]